MYFARQLLSHYLTPSANEKSASDTELKMLQITYGTCETFISLSYFA